VKPRKLVKVGNSYYISLPKELINDWGLTVGSLVAIEYRGSDAKLYPLTAPKDRNKERATLVSDEYVEKRMISAYLNGYDEIELVIKGDRERVSSAIERALKLLVGLEVVEEDSNRVLLQCLTSSDYNVYSIIKRLDYLSRSMYLDAVKALVEGGELASAVVERDDKVDRLYFFAVRLIRRAFKEGLRSREELLRLLDCRLVAKSLEGIGDKGESIAKEVLNGLKVYDHVYDALLAASEEMAELQKRLVKSFIDGGQLAMKDVERSFSRISSRLDRLLTGESPSYFNVVEALRSILEEVNDVYDLTKR